MMKSLALAFLPTMIELQITHFNKSKVKEILALDSPGNPDSQQQKNVKLISLKESKVLEVLAQVHRLTTTFLKRKGALFHTQIACNSLA